MHSDPVKRDTLSRNFSHHAHPSEHKTVQSRILAYDEAIGWTFVPREEAEQRRGFEPQMTQMPADEKAPKTNLRPSVSSAVRQNPDGKVRDFNPRYFDAEGALLGQFCHLHADIYGNRGELI